MRKILFILLLSFSTLHAQSAVNDTSSVDGIIKALYEVISGPPGERNWVRFNNLFTADAKMGATFTKDGVDIYRSFTPAQYVERNAPYLVDHDFVEKEIGRSTHDFGNLVQVFSAYEFTSGTDHARGINSVQLVYQQSRWYIVSLVWQEENEEFKLPEKYLKKSK